MSEPTGVRELAVYPLCPTAVILSWQRLYPVAFRKYILQTFFFNPVTLSSEWTTYYEIAATTSVIASVVTNAHTPCFKMLFDGRGCGESAICLCFLSESHRPPARLVL